MKRPTILIADDDAHLRAALRRRLTALGYDVVEAPDGLGVLSQCPKGWIDVVILDHGMPNGDGLSVARVIRNESDVPIVFLSGHEREKFRAIVMDLPDVYYLSKPVTDEKLESLLASLTRTPSACAERAGPK